MASVGGSRSILFPILSSTGIVLGAIGGLLGVVVGVGAAWLFMRFSSDGSSTQYYGFHLDPVLLAIVIVFAALIGWALSAVAAFIAIASAAVGLARFDGRADDATLASLGAGPRTRCDIAFWQSLLICELGAVLGAGLGILPTFALELPGGASPFDPPWTQIATIAIALPVVIAVASWLLACRAATVQRRVVVS